jgi:5-amino-6-(5-phosphoribosylamino)uracil reductase
MTSRPYTLLSCSMSIDGFLTGGDRHPLPLSNGADLDRVDEVRAGCDAILVGAETIRNDDPRLLVRALARQERRIASGAAASPAKVTVTGRGALDRSARFFTTGAAEKLVYCPSSAVASLGRRLEPLATVVDGGQRITMRAVVEDLHRRGIRRLMVEGGGSVLTQFLTAGLADELQLTIAPVFVGDSRARRVVGDGRFPWTTGNRADLVDARPVGDVALLRYALSDRFSDERIDPLALASGFAPAPGDLA